MKRLKFIQRALCLAVLLALCTCALAASNPRIAISCPYAASGWVAAAAWSAETTAEELGLNYMLKMADSAEAQAEDLELMAEKDYKYIILFPVSDEVEEAAARAMKAGANLLCFGSIPGELVPDESLTFDDGQLGALGAAYLGEKLSGQGRVALITLASDAASERRAAACRDALAEKYPGIEIIGTYAADSADAETGMALMTDLLAANPQLDGVYSCDEALSTGMLRVIEAEGRLGEGGVKVLTGFGGSRAYFDLMDEYAGRIALSVQTASPCALGELLRACDGLAQGEGLEDATLPAETLECEDTAAWLLRNGIAEKAPF